MQATFNFFWQQVAKIPSLMIPAANLKKRLAGPTISHCPSVLTVNSV